jgi:hypothetical protein
MARMRLRWNQAYRLLVERVWGDILRSVVEALRIQDVEIFKCNRAVSDDTCMITASLIYLPHPPRQPRMTTATVAVNRYPFVETDPTILSPPFLDMSFSSISPHISESGITCETMLVPRSGYTTLYPTQDSVRGGYPPKTSGANNNDNQRLLPRLCHCAATRLSTGCR